MITNLELNNFKCYKKVDFDIKPLTVFCGSNSVGKSTAIQSLLLAIQGDFSDKGIPLCGSMLSIGGYSDVRNSNADTDSVSFKVSTKNGSCSWGYELDDLNSPHYEPKGYTERIAIMKDEPFPLLHSSGDACTDLSLVLKNNFQYLCAERWGPKSYYPYSTQRRSKNWLGIHGEYCAQILSNASQLGVLENEDLRKHEKAKTINISENIYEWLSVISPGVFINSKSHEKADIATSIFEVEGEKYRPVNVGFGLSYSLPIIMALLMAKPGGIVILENPEAHLHPKGQSYLGRLIALTSMMGVQVIIETHSDHLLNGIRVASCLSPVYKGDSANAKVYFISKGQEQSNVDGLDIDENGDIPYWPEGFFDQQALDIKSILMRENITKIEKRIPRHDNK